MSNHGVNPGKVLHTVQSTSCTQKRAAIPIGTAVFQFLRDCNTKKTSRSKVKGTHDRMTGLEVLALDLRPVEQKQRLEGPGSRSS